MLFRSILLSSIIAASLTAQDFYFGVSTSEYQISGSKTCPNTNWSEWENLGRTKDLSKGSNEHYTNVDRDIKLIKNLGCNAYRFSIEWSLVEPEEGVFNEAAINHYKVLLAKLKKNQLTPMITLHHFTNPTWFDQKGGFEKEENIAYFVEFCEKIFSELQDDADYFVTFNEPGIYTFAGYVLGDFPPGKKSVHEAAKVMKHLLMAHVETYRALKSINPDKQIGIVHQYLKFEPYWNWNPVESTISYYLDYISHRALLDFFKTKKFSFYIPLVASATYEIDENEPIFDFFGLNYYSNPLITMCMSLSEPIQSSCYKDEKMTDMPFRMYPQGLYCAIKDCSEIGVPLFVTETGIADEKDALRGEFIEKALQSLDLAREQGIDVRGFFYWTLMDNFEWAEGYTKKFGLYEYDFENQTIRLREGSKAYRDGIKKRLQAAAVN